MSWKKKLLKESRLYAIADERVCGQRPMSDIISKIKDSAGIIQLRDKESKKESILKEAYKLRQLLTGTKTIFIINDYIDIAKIADSDGIHLGQNDLPVQTARSLLGKDKIIGVTVDEFDKKLKDVKASVYRDSMKIAVHNFLDESKKHNFDSVITRLQDVMDEARFLYHDGIVDSADFNHIKKIINRYERSEKNRN